MFEIAGLIGIISFYILLPIIFWIARKKMIKAEKKANTSLEELKLRVKVIWGGGILILVIVSVHIICSYKSFISNPLYSVNFTLSLLAMSYFPILYTFFVTIPYIKEKEKEEERGKYIEN